MKLTTYVNFPGKCKEALEFYEEHLGAKIVMMGTFDSMPDAKMIPPGMEKKILHARIMIGDTLLMASDGPHSEPMLASIWRLRWIAMKKRSAFTRRSPKAATSL
jgi:PhnB protein